MLLIQFNKFVNTYGSMIINLLGWIISAII